MHLEEGITVPLIVKESGVSESSLGLWISQFRKAGEAGLKGAAGSPKSGRAQIPAAVKSVIVETKQKEPTWGVTRISQFLHRILHLPGSPETVRQTLHENNLIESKPPRPPKVPAKPRFFERATPNQMWQSDIFTFRLGGKNAYLIGFIDDYSRFITSLGVFRSQTAEHVLETYRRGVGEFGVPREMLTDNGRQYTNWRGKTRFEQELQKDKVHHLRSRPHHPMTLGKIERFWQNIHGEFLCRAQFDDFEQAVERIALWVKYYNHQRPHQGIGGLCPADRFFEVRNDLRKVIERGIQDNLLEIALRGKPQRPFYMVGRVDGQSVVMQATKGKLTMTVGDRENNQQVEVLCDLEKGKVQTHEDSSATEENPHTPA
jgi:transposase InsO family protein